MPTIKNQSIIKTYKKSGKPSLIDHKQPISKYHIEIVYLLYKSTNQAAIAIVIGSLLMAYFHIDILPSWWVYSWVSYMFFLAMSRLIMKFFFFRNSPQDKEIKIWTYGFVLVAALVGIGWGVAAYFFMIPEHPLHQILLILTIVGYMAGAMTTLSGYLPSFLSMSLTALIPLIIRTYELGGEINITLSFLLIVFTIFIISAARRMNTVIVDALKLKFENEDLIVHLQNEKEISEKLNITLTDKIKEQQSTANQLIIAKEAAESASVAKSEFLSNMSHEIRTPLNAILGFIDLLRDKAQDEESQKYLNTIDSSSHSLLGVINDVLDFSKIESGKLMIESIAFNPLKEFNSLADLFKARCSEKNISFIIDINDKLPAGLHADLLRLKQIISNLLSNAIKFTEPDKQIFLTINYSHGYLNCSIKDEGIGMSEEAQAHIFDAFTQAETSTTRQYGGTGLGLAISSSLVEALDGELKLESQLNKGSRFYFKIPVEQVDIVEDDSPEFILNQSFQGHILLVEDNKVNQMLMSVILKKRQLSFDIATDGLEAVSAFQSNTYDLVLMDENMPNLNGIEATKQIRLLEQEEGNSHTPIIALTANAMTGDRERFLEAGMDEYLTKPINKTKLLEVFTYFLNE